MATVLCINSALSFLQIQVVQQGRALASLCSSQPNAHSAELVPIIDACIVAAGLHSIKDVQAVAISTGPGSYTGLRIGMSYAKGASLALGVPIVAYDMFDLLLHNTEFTYAAYQPMVGEVLYKSVGQSTSILSSTADFMQLSASHKFIILQETVKDLVVHNASVIGALPCAAALVHTYYQHQQFADITTLVPTYGKSVFIAQKKSKEG